MNVKRGIMKLLVVSAASLVNGLDGTATAQTWIDITPTGGPSSTITAHQPAGIGYDAVSNRLVLYFPSNPSVTGSSAEVWVATNANGTGGTPAWIQLLPGGAPPFSNALDAVVYDPVSNRLIVYGGCFASCSPALSNVFVLTNANGLGGPPVWSQSTVTNPQARTHHPAVFDSANNLLIAFGGHFAFFGTDQNDTRTLSNADGVASPSTWNVLATVGGPPPIRNQHTAVYDQVNNRMTIFAGTNYVCCNFQIDKNDLWVLESANGMGGTPTWTLQSPLGSLPAPRFGHSAVYDPVNNRMLVFGGRDEGSSLTLGDLWQLTNSNGLGGTPTWTQLTQLGTPPGPRFYHAAAFDAVTQRMIVFGGRNDDGVPTTSSQVWVLVLVQSVAIDIKPGSSPNSINPGSQGVIPVAILTTDTFDATDVDPTTVLFGATGSETGQIHSAYEDIDGDGDIDLILYFNTQATGIQCGNTSASLTGKTFSGQAINGSDSVRTVGCN